MKRCFKISAFLFLSLCVLFLIVISALRFFILPWMAEEKESLAQFLSTQLNAPVSIEKLTPFWEGLEPGLRFQNIIIQHPQKENEKAFILKEALAVFSWENLYRFFQHNLPSFSKLQINHLTIQTEKNENGFYIAGFLLKPENKENNDFSDWFFAQKNLSLKNIQIEHWENNQQTVLNRIHFSMQQQKQFHFYLHFEDADILPFLKKFIENEKLNDLKINEGKVDFNLWGNFVHFNQGNLIANLNLKEGVFNQKQFQIQFQFLGNWEKNNSLWDWTIQLKNATLQIEKEEPLHFKNWRWIHQNGRDDFGAENIHLSPLKAIPLFKNWNPSGVLENARWVYFQNQWALQGTFKNFSLAAVENIHGVKNLSGNFTLTPHAAAFWLDSQNLIFSLPRVFEEGDIPLDFLNGLLSWHKQNGISTVNLQKISFANEDAQGAELHGNYVWKGQGKGEIDLSGGIQKAKGNRVWRYLPLVVPKKVRVWLKNSLLSGEGYDGKLVLKGNLDRFPFKNAQDGQFLITAKSKNAFLRYAPNWPLIENIDADLEFGLGMKIKSQRAFILKTPIPAAEVRLPDFTAREEHILVKGSAAGDTQNFLNFIKESEIQEKIQSFTQAMRAQGKGSLLLNLDLPLRQMEKTQVKGTFSFKNNTLTILPQLAPLKQTAGKIYFTENSIHSSTITGKWLKGNVLGNFKNQESDLNIHLESETPVAELLKNQNLPLHDFLKGTLPWRAQITTDGKAFSLNFQSNLKTLHSQLPPPFSKKEGEAWDFALSANLEKTQFALKNKEELANGSILFKEKPETQLRLFAPLPLDSWVEVTKVLKGKNTVSTVNPFFFSAPEVLWKNRSLGALTLKAQSHKKAWNIQLYNPLLAGTAALQNKKLNLYFSSPNAGILFTQLDYDNFLEGGSAQFSANLDEKNLLEGEWQKLSGELFLDVNQGSFKKISPGVGRLLGFLSLHSFSERLRFNFKDLATEGLAFHRLNGQFTLQNGILRTKNPLKVNAPAAQIAFTGESNLTHENLNVDVDVYPELGFLTAVGLAFINPVAGGVSFLASTLGKNPLDKILYYRYHIGGTWQNPQIVQKEEKLSAEVLPYNPLLNQ